MTNGRNQGNGLTIRPFNLREGLILHDLRVELQDMVDVLLGRQPPPIDTGVSTLMEVAEAYHARAREIEMLLCQGEADGSILKGSKHYHFRTGELRAFIELVRKSIDLGSRRVTMAQMEASLREFG